nr:hypothetical protein [Tanacetum cinerariifolium]
MAVDLLMHTNFHRAFTASTTVPSIYIQQFWDTIQYDKKAGNYRLITADIQEASYYQECQENVAKHRGFLAGETWSTQDLPAPKLAKPARKPKSTAHKAPSKPSISTPPRSSLKSVGNSEAEEVPAVEPRVADEEVDYQKDVEESLKTAHAVHQGPLPPVVIREPESGKYQPPSEVLGKDKAKVTEEHVAHDLLNSEEESKKVLTEASEGGNDDVQTGPDPDVQNEGQKETDANTLDEGQVGSNPDERFEGQAGPDPGITGNEEQSIPNPMVLTGSDHEHMDLDVTKALPQPFMEQLDEGFLATAYPKIQESFKLAVEEQVLLEEPASSSGTLFSLHHLSKDISFEDQFFSDKPLDVDKNAEIKVKSMVNVPIQQAMSSISISPMTSPIIDLSSRPVSPKVHQQFKATTTDTTTITTTVPPPQTQQQSIAEAMMVKCIGELEHILADLIQVNKNMEERLDKHGARLYTLEQLDIPQQVSIAVSKVVTDALDWAMQAPLRNRFRDLPEADMKEILHQRMWETKSYKTHEDHPLLFEALENSMNRDHFEELAQDLAEARKKKRKRHEPSKAPGAFGSQMTPPPLPPPPPSTSQDSLSKGSAVPSPSKMAASTKHQAWTTPDVTLRPFISLNPADLDMDEAMGPDEQEQLSDDEDIGSVHIPTVNIRQDWWKPLEEERVATPEPAWSIPSSDAPVTLNNWASTLASHYSPPPEDLLLAQTGDMATFIDWFCKRRGITELKRQDLEGPAFEIIKVFHLDVIHLQYQIEECHKLLTDSVDNSIPRNNVSKPLPLGGPPGQVTIQSDFFFNKDLEYLRYRSKGNRPALSISKMKATYYPDVGLEQMVPDQFWINEECKYDIAAMYGISHWWFQRQQFYIDRHTSEGDRNTVRHTCGSSLLYESKVKEFKINRMNPGLNMRFWTRKDMDQCKSFTRFYRLSHSESVDIEKMAVCSSLRSLKSKRTIESSAKRSSKIILLGYYSILLASSYTVKSKAYFKSPTHYPCGIARTSE